MSLFLAFEYITLISSCYCIVMTVCLSIKLKATVAKYITQIISNIPKQAVIYLRCLFLCVRTCVRVLWAYKYVVNQYVIYFYVKLADVLNLPIRYNKSCIILIYALNNRITPLLTVFSFVNKNDAANKTWSSSFNLAQWNTLQCKIQSPVRHSKASFFNAL